MFAFNLSSEKLCCSLTNAQMLHGDKKTEEERNATSQKSRRILSKFS